MLRRMTSQFQELDVAINKSFKAAICSPYNTWLTSRKMELTKIGHIQKTFHLYSSTVVLDTLKFIPNYLVKRSFPKCDISILMPKDDSYL